MQGGLYGRGQAGGEKVGRKVGIHGEHLFDPTGGHQYGAIQKAHVRDLRVAYIRGLLEKETSVQKGVGKTRRFFLQL